MLNRFYCDNRFYLKGSVFKNKIEEYFLEFDDLHSKFIPFYTTDLGKQVGQIKCQIQTNNCFFILKFNGQL